MRVKGVWNGKQVNKNIALKALFWGQLVGTFWSVALPLTLSLFISLYLIVMHISLGFSIAFWQVLLYDELESLALCSGYRLSFRILSCFRFLACFYNSFYWFCFVLAIRYNWLINGGLYKSGSSLIYTE